MREPLDGGVKAPSFFAINSKVEKAMEITVHPHSPHLCIVEPGSQCEKEAVPNERVVNGASGLFIVSENGMKHRIDLNWYRGKK